VTARKSATRCSPANGCGWRACLAEAPSDGAKAGFTLGSAMSSASNFSARVMPRQLINRNFCRREPLLALDKHAGHPQSEAVKRTDRKSNAVLWIVAGGFSFLIVITWLTEALRIPYHIFGESFTPNWHRALLRTVVVLAIWAWVHPLTRRLLKRLHHLEEYLRICSWCHKVCHDGEWLEMGKYFNSKFATKTSHGMCPECLAKGKDDLRQRANQSANPGQ